MNGDLIENICRWWGSTMYAQTIALVVASNLAPVSAQWLNYPTASVPRLANGQPNLTSPPKSRGSGAAT